MSRSAATEACWPNHMEFGSIISRTCTSECCGISVRRGCVTRKPRLTSHARPYPNSTRLRCWPTPASHGVPPRYVYCELLTHADGFADGGGYGRCWPTSSRAPARSWSTRTSIAWSGHMDCRGPLDRNAQPRQSVCATATPSMANGSWWNSTACRSTTRRQHGTRISSAISTPRSTADQPSDCPIARFSTDPARPPRRSLR